MLVWRVTMGRGRWVSGDGGTLLNNRIEILIVTQLYSCVPQKGLLQRKQRVPEKERQNFETPKKGKTGITFPPAPPPHPQPAFFSRRVMWSLCSPRVGLGQ